MIASVEVGDIAPAPTFFKIVGVIVEPLALLIAVTTFVGRITEGVPILSPLLSKSIALYQLPSFAFLTLFPKLST